MRIQDANFSLASGCSFSDTITATGAFTTLSSATVASAAKFHSTLDVTGAMTTLSSATVASACLLHSTLDVTGNTTFVGTVSKWASAMVTYVSRGDPAAIDFTVATFTADGGWHALSLSGIVPASASMVKVRCELGDDAINTALHFRKLGNANAVSIVTWATFCNTAAYCYQATQDIECDANRAIEYFATNTVITTLNFTVVGWWV